MEHKKSCTFICRTYCNQDANLTPITETTGENNVTVVISVSVAGTGYRGVLGCWSGNTNTLDKYNRIIKELFLSRSLNRKTTVQTGNVCIRQN